MTARTPLALAALATAAIRGLNAVTARTATRGGDHAGDVDMAVVADDQGREWLVRAPRVPAAGARLESELRALAALAGRLPFVVPEVSGFAPLPEGGRAVVHPLLVGEPLQPAALQPGPGPAASLGRALAALHDLDPTILDEAGLPVYEAEEYRQRRLSELDRAASTGHVPAGLLTRWETELERVSHWRYPETPVHGDLSAEHVLLGPDDEVSAVVEWGEARVADPADDIAWLLVGASEPAWESVLEAYAVARREPPDPHLVDRARLASELALTRWLLHGVRSNDSAVVDDAVGMLRDLGRALALQEP